MPTCTCGFDYMKARLEGREFDSYAVIHGADYRRAIKKEIAILSEGDKQKKVRLIANASQWFGSLMHCPECGAWMLLESAKRASDDESIVLKQVSPRSRKRVRQPS